MKHIHTDKHINHLYYTISSAGCSGAKLLHAKKMNDRSSIHWEMLISDNMLQKDNKLRKMEDEITLNFSAMTHCTLFICTILVITIQHCTVSLHDCNVWEKVTHSLDTAAVGAGELELCARIELFRRKGLLAATGMRSGVLREAPEQTPYRKPQQAVTSSLLVVKC